MDWPALNARGVDYVVVASALEWRSSARYGDTVEVDADLEKLGRTSLTVRFAVRVGERRVLRRPHDLRLHRRRDADPVARGDPRAGQRRS